MDDAAYEALMARLNEAYPSQPAYTSPDVKLQSGQITQQQGQDPVILTNPRTLQQGESNPIEFDQSGGVSQLGAMMNAGRLRGMLDMSGQDGMTPGYNAMLTAGGPDGFSTSYRRSNEIGGRGDAQNAIMIAKQFGERNAPSPSLSAGANWSGTGGPITYDLSGSVPLTTGRNPEAPQFRLPSSREEQPMVPLTRRDRERQPSRQEVKGAISAGLSHSPRDHSTRANAGLKFNYADGGHVDAALHLLRQHFDEGGFLSSLSNLFSGPDYLSNGKEASFANMPTQDETNADFFKADRALRLAQQASEPARDMPLPLRRPAPEAAPRQQVAAPAPAPAPAPVQAFRPVTTLPIRDVDEPHDFPPVTTPSLAFGEPVYGGKTQRLGGDEGQNRAPAVQMDYTLGHGQNLWPSSGNFKTLAGTVPENFNSRFGNLMSVDDARQSMMFRPEPRAEISRAVSLAQNLAPQQEAIPSAADALAAVKNLHNAGVYSGEALDKAGEILAAHNRAMFDNIPVEEALRLIRAEGPRMVNQGMPREERPAVQPLAYTAAPTPAPAAQAITEAMPATGKLTARIPDEPHGTALTKQQADYVIRTIAAETSGKSPEETQAIASVILNRINSGRYGATPEAVLFAKRQFEPWMNPAGKNYPMKISPTSQRYSDARDALEAAMAGEDITRGAINFWGPKSQYSLGRDTPDWALKMPDYTDIGATRFHRPNSPIQMAQAQAQEVPSTGLFAFGTNDPNPQTALKSAQQIYENARRAGIDPVFVLPNSADPRFAPISEALKKYADERGIKYETPGYDPKDPLHITPDTAKEIAKKYPGALVGGDSNSWRLQKYGYGRPVSSPNAFVDKGTGVKLGQVGAGSPDVAKWFGQYVDRLSRGRASGGLVDDALHVVREHHADGEGVGQAPVATDNSERVRAAESAANLAKQIQAYEASMASIRQQPQDIQSMTHAPEKPRAPISVEALGKNREFGSAPYDVAGPLSSFAQGAYDMKTLPLYMYPPTAPLGMAIDTAEGMASGSPTQVAMGALGGPLKVARNVIAPLAVATGVTAPDEAEAGSLSKLFGKMVSPAKRAENLVKFKAGNVEDVPSVVYHGTGNDIHQFDTTKGAWFTDTPSLASEYANKPGGNVVPAHIALKNPIEFVHAEQRKPIGEVISTALSGARDLSAEQINAAKPIVDVLRKRYGKDARPLFEYWNNDPDVTKLFKTLGYDGISAFEKADRKAKTWSIFSPEQAKSAIGNAGTFDPTKARLNEAKGGSVEDRALMLVSRQA